MSRIRAKFRFHKLSKVLVMAWITIWRRGMKTKWQTTRTKRIQRSSWWTNSICTETPIIRSSVYKLVPSTNFSKKLISQKTLTKNSTAHLPSAKELKRRRLWSSLLTGNSNETANFPKQNQTCSPRANPTFLPKTPTWRMSVQYGCREITGNSKARTKTRTTKSTQAAKTYTPHQTKTKKVAKKISTRTARTK